MDISVVIPVFNESENIETLAEEIRTALDGKYQYEVVYVDDGSSDETPQVLERLRRAYPQFRSVRHLRNSGQSTAVRNGVKAARGEWIVTLDGDGQNDPADIPRFIEVMRKEGEGGKLQMVAGYRKKRQDDWIKRYSSRVANKVRASLLKDATPDSVCGLKMYRREVFLDLPYFDHMHRFLPALIQRNGGETLSLEVNHRPRNRGVSKYGVGNRLWVGIVDLLGLMWLQRRVRLTEVEEQE
jgi:dolichol-phosphate mannosyltransferase